jgi:ADP-ribose pyrophosphatase YjhB (NUDIX family)
MATRESERGKSERGDASEDALETRAEAGNRTLLEIADQLRAIATTGTHFATNTYERERHEKLMTLAAQLAGLTLDADPSRIEDVYREADSGYVTPKLDVRMAVFREDRVLMVRERQDGRWSLPGGFVDVGDSAAEAAVRETWEEAGVRVRASRLVGIFDRRLHPDAPPHIFHILKVVFTGELLDPDAELRPGPEVFEAAFQPVEDPPELSLSRTLPIHLSESLRVARDPTALPYFE